MPRSPAAGPGARCDLKPEHTMSKEAEIEKKFWKSLRDDRTVMLGLTGIEEGHAQPMTAQILHEDDERGAIWFFTAKDTDLVQSLGDQHAASLQFASKGHDLFATVRGELMTSNNRVIIDKLWNTFVAAWYQGGKDDPKLQLLRFEPQHAQVWLNEHSLWAGVKLMLGQDPKQDYGGKTAELELRSPSR
jgi:general stress protein 26